MAICPFAVQQIIPESHTQGRITPTTLIYHRAVSSAESLLGYWTTPGVELESHFYIGQWGTLYQFMDTEVRADANVDANSFAISVETWDGGNTPDDMPWNAAQLATAKLLAAWVCETHSVKRAAAETWNGGGIGGHNWFPYPWADGPRGCPGTARNAQIRNDIIPYVADGGGWKDDNVALNTGELATLMEVRDNLRRLHDNLILGQRRGDRINEDLGYVRSTILTEVGGVKAVAAATQAQVAAIANDPDITADQLATVVNEAVARHTPTAEQVAAAQLPHIQAAVREVLGEDNASQADEIVRRLGERLAAD